MMRHIIKTFFKIMLTLGAIFAVLVGILYLTDHKTNYIEVYNDDEGDLYQ